MPLDVSVRMLCRLSGHGDECSVQCRFIAGGSLATRPDDEKPGPASGDQVAEMRSAFEEHLAEFEQQLAKHEGPFLLGCAPCCLHIPRI